MNSNAKNVGTNMNCVLVFSIKKRLKNVLNVVTIVQKEFIPDSLPDYRVEVPVPAIDLAEVPGDKAVYLTKVDAL